ncbi:MAG: CD225/dispanin family protein [Actinobacteria bacterium]|jgi:hypothetical protein|nr:CD225/dispanin family protein [Actinomycetota bacterium]
MTDMPASVEPALGVRTYLGWSVLASVLCFLPLGLVAVYYGLRTSSAVARGDSDAAGHGSRVAKGWLISTLVVGLFIYVFLGAVFVLLGAFSE